MLVQDGSTTAIACACSPSATDRWAVAPARSASSRSTGCAASRNCGSTCADNRNNATPRRTLLPSRNTSPRSSNGPNNRYTAARLAPMRAASSEIVAASPPASATACSNARPRSNVSELSPLVIVTHPPRRLVRPQARDTSQQAEFGQVAERLVPGRRGTAREQSTQCTRGLLGHRPYLPREFGTVGATHRPGDVSSLQRTARRDEQVDEPVVGDTVVVGVPHRA